MTWGETYYNTPGSVENYLDWTGGLTEGNRGVPTSNESVTSITITGIDEVLTNLELLRIRVHDKVMHELRLWCEDILSASKKEVPWDTTHLLQTGAIQPIEEGFMIGYNTPYAARQHEDMTFHHPKPGTKAKYLEDPAMRIAPLIAPGITQALKDDLG